MKSAVNKPDREVKTNNSEEEHVRAEVKCSSSEVRAAASVQWENNDKLHVHTTQKQTYTGTETDSGGRTHETEFTAEEESEARETSGKTEQNDDENHENDEDQGTESQVQDWTDESNGISKHDQYSEEVPDFSKTQIEEMMPGARRATEQDEESQPAQDLEEIGRFEQKDGVDEERDQDREVETCDMMRDAEQDTEQDKPINMTGHGETEDTVEHAEEHLTDEPEKHILVQKNQGEAENDEEQGPESREQDLTHEGISKHDQYSDEIDEFSKSVVEEMMLGAEQNEDMLIESAETLQREPETEQNETLEDTLLSDPEQHTAENTPESGTGSDLIVSEFPGESTDWGGFEEIQTKLHDPQSPAERDPETEHDTEARIQTELSLKEHVEFRTELIVETKISSEDEEALPVSSQPHQLLEITEGRCKATLDAFSATSEITGSAEDQTDVKPVFTRSSSLTELLEDPVDLQADVAKTALEYVEEITNQVLKDMIEAEKSEPLVEAPGDAAHQAPASVLEEEQWTMDSSEEHISAAECENTDGRHDQMQKPIAGESLEDLMDVSRPGMKRGFDQMSEGLPEVKTEGHFELILQVM